MAISVVSNPLSINAQRNLAKSGLSLAKSLERLSSGLRINRAGDDAAGLAISEGLRSQIRGLNQATRNANDGISLLSTAEGAVAEVTSILQRIRELSVQAASDTNSAANRASLQEEITQLISEVDRIATTVEFNGTKLLDGTFSAKKLQVGAFANQTISVSFTSIRTNSLGQVASATGTAVTAALTAGQVTINGVSVGATVTDGVSTVNNTGSAISVANAINNANAGVTATANATTRTGTAAIGTATLNGTTDSLSINGVNVGAVTIVANDADSALRNAINAVSNSTGVTASVDASGALVLTAEDGRNIALDVASTAGDTTALALNFAATDAATDALDTRGTVSLISDKSFIIGGSAPANAGLTAGTYSPSAATAINTVSVTTQVGANTAIQRVDHALRQINNNRAGLGAITNRLESTVSSLQSIVENLSASESRIRDADFAAETAALTRNQILQQAGIAILAQANAVPQLALSLLS
jgi:flagellin